MESRITVKRGGPAEGTFTDGIKDHKLVLVAGTSRQTTTTNKIQKEAATTAQVVM
jgi:hypothetical protein